MVAGVPRLAGARVIAQALQATALAAVSWLAIFASLVHIGCMTKAKAILVAKTAAVAALGAILPMLPTLLGDTPGPLGSAISAVVTAVAFLLRPVPEAK